MTAEEDKVWVGVSPGYPSGYASRAQVDIWNRGRTVTAEDQDRIDRVASKLRATFYQDSMATLDMSMHKGMWREMAVAAIREAEK